MYTKEQSFLRAEKKVKSILGFYTHATATVFIIPFIILINLKLVPEAYHWYWFFIGAWALGLLIHWFAIFGYNILGLGKDWEEKKIKELMEEDNKLKHN